MRDDIEKRYHDILFHSETDEDFIAHYGVKGQKHGIRRWQNEDGSLTPEGYRHYGIDPNKKSEKPFVYTGPSIITKAKGFLNGLGKKEAKPSEAEMKRATALDGKNDFATAGPKLEKLRSFDNAKWEKNEAGEWIVDDKYEFNVYKGVPKDKAKKIYESMDDECFDKEAVLKMLTSDNDAKYYGPDYDKDLSDLIGDKVQIDLLEDKHGIGEDGVYTSLGYVSDKAVDDFVDKYGVFPGVTFLKDKRGRYTLKAASVDYGD